MSRITEVDIEIAGGALKSALNGKANASHTHTTGDVTGLGTAATLNHGTSAGNLVRLDPSTAKLPAVDGSLLTNLPGGGAGLELITTVNVTAGSTGVSFNSAYINGTYEKYFITGNFMSGGSVELGLALVQNGTVVSDHAWYYLYRSSETPAVSGLNASSSGFFIPVSKPNSVGGTYSWPLSFEIWLDAGKPGDNQGHTATVRSKGRGDYGFFVVDGDGMARSYGDLNGAQLYQVNGGTFSGGTVRLYGFKK